jgi:L-2-hydroxyglutarate oxidase
VESSGGYDGVNFLAGWDFCVVGAGIVGTSIAREIKSRKPDKTIIIVEKEGRVGSHTSSRNSGVIHSGINQKPGGLKAKLCVRGNALLKDFCRKEGVPMEEVGTVVLARDDAEGEVIRELQRRGTANGAVGVRIIDREELKQVETYAEAREALISPSGAIVDNARLVAAVAEDAIRRGISVALDSKVRSIVDRKDHLTVETGNAAYDTKYLINCAGLYADKVAWMMGCGRDYCVIPFRGDYYRLTPEKSYLVKSMIYPAPNLEMPFLGVHLTKRTDGAVIVGPNASLALGREKYREVGVNWVEVLEMVFDLRFARLMSDPGFFKVAMHEAWLTLSKGAFVKAARSLVPAIKGEDLVPDQSGIRAQLVNRKGKLVDDFLFEQTDKSFHVLNAVSPAMTCGLSFAEHVADLIFNEQEKSTSPV